MKPKKTKIEAENCDFQDAGYGDKFMSVLEDDNDEDTQKLDDEIKVAPWHTTRAYTQVRQQPAAATFWNG